MSLAPSGGRDLSRGWLILVVEYEALVSMMLEEMLTDLGYEIVGPATRVAKAIELIDQEKIDGAILDVNVAGEQVYPVADALARRGIRFAFVTGYGNAGLARLYADRPTLNKPFSLAELDALLRREILPKGQ
jgi:CheY-like chemotaxis protein